MVHFLLNGKETTYEGDPSQMLLKYLRGELHIISPKEGCSGQAYCGSCSVLIDGKSTLSCITPMKRLQGKNVVTTEGLPAKIQEVIASAFVQKGGVQCGFCTPGMVISAAALLEKNLHPSEHEIVTVLNRHMCRCTGYIKVVEAIMFAAKVLRGESQINLVDGITPKYLARETALGFRPFVADMYVDNMHFGVLKFSDHPRAKVLHINVSAAESAEGVLRVITARDFPVGGNRYIGLIIQDWPVMIAEGETTNYVGDVLALVVAKSETQARNAVELINVDYEVLPPITEVDYALSTSAPLVHPSVPQRQYNPQLTGNLLSSCEIKRGDVNNARQQSAYIYKNAFHTQRIEHGFLEVECCLAVPVENCQGEAALTVYSQGQGVYEDRKQICKILGIRSELVRVIQVQSGGGFGGKEDLTVQGHAALAAQLLRVPVRVALSREESLRMHPKRHPMLLDYEVGCSEDGKLTFLKADIIGDSGAYASVGMKVLERAAGHAAGAYQIPVVEITAKAVYTNNVPCGAMRGFGVNQAVFAIEGCIDELCSQGGYEGNFDRWQFRYNNALDNGSLFTSGQVLEDGVGLKETLLAVKDIFKNAKHAGIACGVKNCGVGNGMADVGRIKLVVESAKKIVIHHGWTEMGQGVHTVAIRFLYQETGLNPLDADFEVEVKVDTENEVVCGMTTSSRATSLVGHAMIVAAKKLKEDLQQRKNPQSLEELVGKVYDGEWVCDWTTKPGHERPGDKIVTHYSYSYSTQVVVLTDNGKIEHVYVAQDAGKVVNPLLFSGQIEGSVHMGLGYALTEDFPSKDGYSLYTRFQKCGILKAKDMPKVTVIPIEVPDKFGPHGAKGVGEIGMVPTAAAVVNAYSAYDGIRYLRLPIKKMKGSNR
ncbi:MAG: selenium-dependent xanthine dehydrogenase [Oligoflexia bacterium]|nr:selenium-dependent xanthine dehydrogenase [Oligoflexia bacterium]